MLRAAKRKQWTSVGKQDKSSKKSAPVIAVATRQSVIERWLSLSLLIKTVIGCGVLLAIAGIIVLILVTKPAGDDAAADTTYATARKQDLADFTANERAPATDAALADQQAYYGTKLDLELGSEDYAQAIKTYETLTQRSKGEELSFDTYAMVAQAYYKQDDTAKAKQALDKALAQADQMTDPDSKANAQQAIKETRERWGL